jgi:sorbitol-specific phosphotransferase system component IIBC
MYENVRDHLNGVLYTCLPLVFVLHMYPHIVARKHLGKIVTTAKNTLSNNMIIVFVLFLIPFYLQAVQIHSANGVKLLES